MTSPSDILSEIEKALESATHGDWYLAGKLTIRHTSPIGGTDGWVGKVNWRNGEANARFIASCSPDRMREVLALARRAEESQRRAEAAEALAERMKLEAQGHAMEVRTANSTIHEIYQVVSGATGEPGNWHGANPVREYVARTEALVSELQRENAEKDARIAALEEALKPFGEKYAGITPSASEIADGAQHPDVMGDDALALITIDVAHIRCARTLLEKNDAQG